ncbi:hypothetical protein D7231_31885 [Streptomyces klenkii]|uniref:Uncharacterized protein n=1 Tax=Streptomyces klenkii TaxID=1420899 RepID=A0A3B0ALK5_9ACTN|nr:hypothetical protein D7231_31885 [Streptomyces klenkii]
MATAHVLTIEREALELPSEDGWAMHVPGPHARATCSCGLDTGWTPAARAHRTFDAHRSRHHHKVNTP